MNEKIAITEENLLHSEFLRELAQRLVEHEDFAHDIDRLRDIANGLRFRPELDMAKDFRFELGKVYPTREGKLVRIVETSYEHDKVYKGNECVRGDDGTPWTDEKTGEVHPGGWRYNRSSGTYDAGRCTGSPDDTPRNLLPIEITDDRVKGLWPFPVDSKIEYLIPVEGDAA